MSSSIEKEQPRLGPAMENKLKTKCLRGHDFIRVGNRRNCSTCMRENARIRADIERKKRDAGLAQRTCSTKEYITWKALKKRCYYKLDKSYKYYGGRGITVYGPWIQSFKLFLDHVGPAPSKAHSIDRINNNGNYEPGNVRWATKIEQANNKRNNIKNRPKIGGAE